jgi:hypothetical protein
VTGTTRAISHGARDLCRRPIINVRIDSWMR